MPLFLVPPHPRQGHIIAERCQGGRGETLYGVLKPVGRPATDIMAEHGFLELLAVNPAQAIAQQGRR